MAVFDGINAIIITSQAQARLMSLRQVLEGVADYKQWLDGIGIDDLTAAGLTPDGAQALKDAMADAADLATIANGGTPVATVPHNFMASIRRIIGPLF